MDKSLLAGLGVGTALVVAGFTGSAVLFPPSPQPADMVQQDVAQDLVSEPEPVEEPAPQDAAPEPEPEPAAEDGPAEPLVPESDADIPAPEMDDATQDMLPDSGPDMPQGSAGSAEGVADDLLPVSPAPEPEAAATRLPSGIQPAPRGERAPALPQVLPSAPAASEAEPPITAAPPEDALAAAPRPGTEPATAQPGARISRLPQIGGTDAPLARAADVPPPSEAVVTALERNSLYAGTEDRARMAVILADPGLPSSMRQALAEVDLPLTIALNPLDSSATEAAELYRDAGKEVVILATSIPEGATASDLDVTFSAFFAAVPTAVAVIDLPESGFARNVGLLSQVLPLLAQDGHGLLTFSGGLAQSARAAQSSGITHAEVFRSLDAGDESAFTIRRFLDRAVFQASQTGQVIVFGDASNAATMEAIEMWTGDGPPEQVAIAPVSGILLNSR